jgi:hypothetical protein
MLMLPVFCSILLRPNLLRPNILVVLMPLLTLLLLLLLLNLPNLQKLLSFARLSLVPVELCQQTASFNHA